MKKSFGARRTPRKVGLDEEDDGDAASNPESTVQRPLFKSQKSSSLRNSIGATSFNEDEDGAQVSVVTPKRSHLSRVAIQRNAAKRSSLSASSLPLRPLDDDDDRPSYTTASLQELKDSTPSTPRNVSANSDSDTMLAARDDQALDLSSRYGFSLASYEQPSAIPSAAEIAEKKARRARLAMESQEYISLDPDDPGLDDGDLDENMTRDERGQLILKPKPTDKWGLSESRIVQDDEDIMENFDEFTEDGRIALSRQAEMEASRKRRQEMSAQIAEAEAASGSESDNSERERIAAYEASQTKHGTYAQKADSDSMDEARPKTPPFITPLPTLDGAIERLRKQLADMQSLHMQKLKEMEILQREKIHLAEEEVRIQRALKETADKFEALRKEKGIAAPNATGAKALEVGLDTGQHSDDVGDNSQVVQVHAHDEQEEEADEGEEDTGFAGLGFGGARHGFGASGMLAVPLPEPGDSQSDSD